MNGARAYRFLLALLVPLGACTPPTNANDMSGSLDSAVASDLLPPPRELGIVDLGPPDLSAIADLSETVDGKALGDLTTSDMAGRVSPFCALPGSVVWAQGKATVVGGALDGGAATDLRFMHLPDGYCAHFFANVGNARQLRFAPGGELFVASPTRGTTGGGANGLAAVVILPDDNADGVGDAPITFLGNLGATQGIAFAPGFFYYQDNAKILRLPYKAGDRAPAGASTLVTTITIYNSGLHWPKPIDIADDGTIYVGNGGDQGEACDPLLPFHGGILKLDGAPGGTPVARGLRNPIALRCARGHDRCFALELAQDYSAMMGGREKMIPIHGGDDWGYPCCATQNLPYMGLMPVPNCAAVTPESASFIIGDTPFGEDFETGLWPAPYTGSAFVALHGAFGTWQGAKMVAIKMDPATGLPLPGTDLQGKPTGAMSDFAIGWDDNSLSHGRPAAVTFAADGRLFLSNDNNGDIVWIAPVGL